jgi:hypothetical protein
LTASSAVLLTVSVLRSCVSMELGTSVDVIPAIHALPGDTILLRSESSGIVWCIISPVRGEFDNLTECDGIEPLPYLVSEREALSGSLLIEAGSAEGYPELGTFYVGVFHDSLVPPDTMLSLDPPHFRWPGSIVQIATATDETYIGYLFELWNTPFVMTPRYTPSGAHQTDDRMGCDCASFAVYGKRRQGFDFDYLGPHGILEYLEPVFTGTFLPVWHDSLYLYENRQGERASIGEDGLVRGDVLHFDSQVSVFYRDAGCRGFLDSEDLVIQSLHQGPHVCPLRNNGYFELPFRIMRWAE